MNILSVIRFTNEYIEYILRVNGSGQIYFQFIYNNLLYTLSIIELLILYL